RREPVAMSTSPQQEVTYIATPKTLEVFCGAISDAKRIAVDTEFVGEKYYYPRLELIQVSDGSRIGLIDVQTCGSLEPLAKVLSDPERLKIFHAAESDIPILRRALECEFLPLFDTQVAASLLGHGAQISLTNLVRNQLGVQVSSKQSTSDWSQRPLTTAQLEYAANDVLHLHELEEALRADLASENRIQWYEDEQQARLESLSSYSEDDIWDCYRRVKDWVSLSPREMAILRELAAWREETARRENVPRRMVFTDEGLIELSRFSPGTRDAARKLRRIHQGQINRYFDTLAPLIKHASQLPRDQWPEKPTGERPDIPTGLLELCQALVRTEGERHRIAPTVIATSAELQRVVNNRADLNGNGFPILKGWRGVVVGEKLKALLRGEITVSVAESGELLFEDRQGT
ncbi:MAG: ribonuclease D, partial [Candidatus Sumerlaeia bacterium]|nr:ribonuclease D [Candidatus Sumerlaeia bacterium]